MATTSTVTRYWMTFGDSLTEGYYSYGRKFHPYSTKLQQLLENNFKSSKWQVLPSGLSGESTEEMIERLPGEIETQISHGIQFEYIIILGGTNDLGNTRMKPEESFNNLMSLHTISAKYKSKTCAIAIPQHPLEIVHPFLFEKRKKINYMLKSFCEEKGLPYIPLDEKMPLLSYSETEKLKYTDDGLHFTPLGYDKMAEIIFETLQTKITP